MNVLQAKPSDESLGYFRSSLPGLENKTRLSLPGLKKEMWPVSLAAKQRPHRPGNPTALGLRAEVCFFNVPWTSFQKKEYSS
jgi:hypothetical protein